MTTVLKMLMLLFLQLVMMTVMSCDNDYKESTSLPAKGARQLGASGADCREVGDVHDSGFFAARVSGWIQGGFWSWASEDVNCPGQVTPRPLWKGLRPAIHCNKVWMCLKRSGRGALRQRRSLNL